MKSRGRVMVPVPANTDSGIQGPANPTPCTFPIVLLLGLFLTLLHPLRMAIIFSLAIIQYTFQPCSPFWTVLETIPTHWVLSE